MARASLRVVVRFKNVCRERLTEAEGAKSVVRVVLRLCLSISGLGQNSGLAKGLLSARASGRYLAVERDVSRGSTKEVGVAGPGVLRAESPGVRYASRFATKLTFFFSKRLGVAAHRAPDRAAPVVVDDGQRPGAVVVRGTAVRRRRTAARR